VAGRLEGKIAIVAGAGSTPGETLGNGRAAALLFAREGARVMLVDRDGASAEETRRLVEAEGASAAWTFEADVSRDDDCRRLAEACLAREGRIDVLHNNVGVGTLGGPVETSEADWDRVVDTNLKSVFLTCKHVLPAMERQGAGAIVNVSSIGAVRHSDAYPLAAYAASKGGVNSLTRAIAMQYAAKGVRANAIMPGLIETPMAVDEPARRLGVERARFARIRAEAVPMRRMGEAWDVAYAALFLASDEAKYVTGVVLAVDGGLGCKA
jgi:NAD(P)-dependent dehydrogenase (short-subunit alcohol dehydrogenase family)